MNSLTTLSEVLNKLRTEGYTLDFNLKENCIHCGEPHMQLDPSEFEIDRYFRFEGESNPDDSAIVYAISSKDGQKGVLVDAYGIYSDSLSAEMIEKLRIKR
ncbi:MAG TPA: phosphoribosylpyrophosphate synthetase [Parasegetibacter sp.]